MATTSAGLGLEEISSKLNANGRKKRTPKTVEDAQQIEQSEDILRYGGSGKGRKFLYGIAAAIVGEDNAKKVAKKYGNREEQEKAFENIYGKEKKPRKQNKTTEQIPKSELKDYLEQLKQSLDDISDIKDILERIEKRISPRDVTIGKGVQAQTYRFDPLAPLEKQVTEVNETGLAGSFAGKKETAAVLSKAAYFGNKDLISRKEQQDKKLGITAESEKESENKKTKKVERKANVKQTVQKVQPIEIKEIIKEIKNQFKITNKLIRDTSKNKTKISQPPKPQSQNLGKPKFNTFQEYEEYQNKVEEAKDTVKYGGTSFGKKFVYGFRQQLLGDKYAQRKARENANKQQREEALRLLNPEAFKAKETSNPRSISTTQVKPITQTSVEQTTNQAPNSNLEPSVQKNILQITKDISTIKGGVERIEKRISPRDITVGTGEQAQTYRFDPLAPEGKQVTEVKESGLAGGIASKEGGGRSDYQKVLSKAAYLGNEDLIAKKEQQDKLENPQAELNTNTSETTPVVQQVPTTTVEPISPVPIQSTPAPVVQQAPTIQPAQVTPPTVVPPPLPQQETPNFIKKLQEKADELSKSKFVKDLEEKANKLAESPFVKKAIGKAKELSEKVSNSDFIKNLNSVPNISQVNQEPIITATSEVEPQVQEQEIIPEIKPAAQTIIPSVEQNTPAEPTTQTNTIKTKEQAEKQSQVQEVDEKPPGLNEIPEYSEEEKERRLKIGADLGKLARIIYEWTLTNEYKPKPSDPETAKKAIEAFERGDLELGDETLNKISKRYGGILVYNGEVLTFPDGRPANNIKRNISEDLETGEYSETLEFLEPNPEQEELEDNNPEIEIEAAKPTDIQSVEEVSSSNLAIEPEPTKVPDIESAIEPEPTKVPKIEPEPTKVPEIEPEPTKVPEIEPEPTKVPAIEPAIEPEPSTVPAIEPEVKQSLIQENSVITQEPVLDIKPTSQTSIQAIEQPIESNQTSKIKNNEVDSKLNQVINSTNQIPEIGDAVSRVEKRVSPRDITTGKGDEAQTYRFDPLAPEGKQVTEVKESGLAGSFADKATAASVLSKAAYLGNQDLTEKKQQQDLRKEEQLKVQTPEVEVASEVQTPEVQVSEVQTPEVQVAEVKAQQVPVIPNIETIEQPNSTITPQLETKVDQIIQSTKDLPEVKDGVDRIEKRVSPRDITVGKGEEAQTYRFDPLAPEGKQVTEVAESGLAGSFAGKKEEAAVLSKAAYLGNQDIVAKKEQQDLRKAETEQPLSQIEIKPAPQQELQQELKGEQKEKTLEQRQTENEEKTNKLIKEVKEQLIVTNKLIVSSKTIGQSLKPGQQGQGKQKFASGEEFEAHQEEVEKAKDIVKFGGTGFAKKFAFGFKEKLLGEKFARKSAAKNANKEEREKALRLLNPDKIQPAEQGAVPPPLPGDGTSQETPDASSAPQGSDLMQPAVTPAQVTPTIQPTQAADPSGNTSEAESAQTVAIQRDAAEAQQEDREKIISQLEKIDKKLDELLEKDDDKGGILSSIAKVLGIGALAEGAAAAAGGLATAASAALPALAVGAAGAAGYVAGKGIDKGVEAVTGRAASDWAASGVGSITGQNAEGNEAAHAGESSFKQRAEATNSRLKGTGYELVSPGKYKGPDGKIVSANELPSEIKSMTKPGAMPDAQGVVRGKIERPAEKTAPAPAPIATEAPKTEQTASTETKADQPQARTTTPAAVPAAMAATGTVTSESKEKQQQDKITTLTAENAVLKSQTSTPRAAKVPRVTPPTPPPQQKKEKKEDVTVIQIRNVEQSVATYTASIFDHPVVHPGIYKM